jgi:uncharacterized membrane protein
MMTRYLTAYVGAAVVFSLLDAAWLMFASARFYKPILGSIMVETPRWTPVILFYLLYLAGIVFFAVAPAWRTESWTTAAVSGAALGLIAYGTYDLTNQATLIVWSVKITVMDMAWGSFVTAAGAVAGYSASSLFTK